MQNRGLMMETFEYLRAPLLANVRRGMTAWSWLTLLMMPGCGKWS